MGDDAYGAALAKVKIYYFQGKESRLRMDSSFLILFNPFENNESCPSLPFRASGLKPSTPAGPASAKHAPPCCAKKAFKPVGPASGVPAVGRVAGDIRLFDGFLINIF